jgi:uncharacterized damage-inducible protein DinB
VHPLLFFDQVVEHRHTLLGRFREAPPEAFHAPLLKGTWSCEAYFRHLLTGCKWMMDAIPGTGPIDMHPLAVNTRAWPGEQASLDEVEGALRETTAEVRRHLAELAPQVWQRQVQDDPAMTLEQVVYGLLEHEIEHHGMIRWILKRYTGWDDNHMYEGEIP